MSTITEQVRLANADGHDIVLVAEADYRKARRDSAADAQRLAISLAESIGVEEVTASVEYGYLIRKIASMTDQRLSGAILKPTDRMEVFTAKALALQAIRNANKVW